ncbi:MAG: PQQ-dependent sugar dehydrogenase [Chloroflexota bacterium]|nr:PQQ-dependent sugar dehydrogenase [Chloroflexota bacterium]MDE2884128.1 PQQ-dependent sugar dehydrogenase [Chloroflexota bacterium]
MWPLLRLLLIPALSLLPTVVLAGVAHAPNSALPTLELERVFPALTFERPVLLTHAADGSGEVYVVEQRGVVHRIDPATPERTETFLDISGRVSRGGNEEGLLGLAFDPVFAENGRFYVYYSAASPRRSVLSRFHIRADGLGDPGSESVVLEVAQPYSNHNGGMIAFGPDGMLYVALGDGGSAGDPQRNGQDIGTLLGNILRIDVTQREGGRAYAIPADNPFAGRSDARGEIWAFGLRNPWRFSFDRETGDLWTGDVGQNALEEVDIVQRGGNYGWNVMEGSLCFRPAACDPSPFAAPVTEYGRDAGCSITGGYVYRGQRLPELRGVYLYGDYCSGRIWGLRWDGERVTEQAQLARADFQIPSFGEDGAGEVYVLGFDGGIYTFAGPSALAPQPAAATRTPTPNPAPTRTAPVTATLAPVPTVGSAATATPVPASTAADPTHVAPAAPTQPPEVAPGADPTPTPAPPPTNAPVGEPTPTPGSETHVPSMSSDGAVWAVVAVVVVAALAGALVYAGRRYRGRGRR